jgi:hypothetical protein
MRLLKDSQADQTQSNYEGQRWEYKARNLHKVAGLMLETDFNRMGTEGWEYVAMATGGKEGYAIFRRPL